MFLFSPVLTEAFEDDLERDLQKSLAQSKLLVETIKTRLAQGGTITSELNQLKNAAENVRIADLLLRERFRLREEKAKALGTKAVDRHKVMAEGYRAALTEYLKIIDGLPSDGVIPESTIRNLKSLLEKILPKRRRPIIGSLPYKHLNYPAQEPTAASAITPAYKGGNKSVSPDDTKSTPEAPISKEIAALAQSLNWQPVAIYEHVKNTIETEWYYGCMKGAEETLRQKSGNDCDQTLLLTALLRASGFPTRIVRGSVQFFASDDRPIERIKNLIGINDPWKIAEFFQKAGVPYKPIIAGGKIVNFQIEHIWVESQIPYANYRGAIIDELGKTWLGLDTSIKVKDYVYNTPKDIFQEAGIVDRLSGIRDEYLGAVQALTPLEYLKNTIEQSAIRYEDYLRGRTLPEEHLHILPAGLQFTEVLITNEYAMIPAELRHKVRFSARDSQKAELLNIELDTFRLSNQQVAVTYEPETVEDQEIIDSYGGLDNTPAYLVRLRPVLTVNKERIIVAQNGLPMGSEYDLTIDLVSPQGTETITNSMITGNLTVIGIAAGKAVQSSELSAQTEKDAERLLYESAQHYIDRWNKAEDELASLLHLTIARPLPTVVTLAGMIDVTYLLDMPHGFTWKGVYVDADFRVVEAVHRTQTTDDRTRLFVKLSSLQGSILENRIFEDDFKVESISTAKLFQLCASNSVLCTQMLTIDKTNIGTMLPTLSFDDNVKEDMINAVNQGYELRTPNSELTYHDWTGTGYIKENPETGESGWMLSGMIAGGCPVDAVWLEHHYQDTFSQPYTGASNNDPLAARFLVKVSLTDKQPPATVDGILPQYLAVFVSDSNGLPVKGAKVTFRTVAGGGKLKCLDFYESPMGEPADQCTSLPTDNRGIAKVQLILGKKTGDNPIYQLLQSTDTNYTQIGLNLVTAAVQSHIGEITLPGPFEAYGKPDMQGPKKIVTIFPTGTTIGNNTDVPVKGVVNNPGGVLSARFEDQHGNPISNADLQFKSISAVSQNPAIPTLPATARKIQFYNPNNCTGIYYPLYDECGPYVQEQHVKTEYFGGMVHYVYGNTVGTKYQVQVAAPSYLDVPAVTYTLYSAGSQDAGYSYIEPTLLIGYLELYNDKGDLVNAAKAGAQLSIPLSARLYLAFSELSEVTEPYSCTINGQQTTCWKQTPLGTIKTVPISNGTIHFNPTAVGASATPQEVAGNIDGNGLYRTRYTTGTVPSKNSIEGWGEADIQAPEIIYDTVAKVYMSRTEIPDWQTVRLKSGQQAHFDTTGVPHADYCFIDMATQKTYCYTDNPDKFTKITYTVYGVDVHLAVEPNIVLINEDGHTTADTTFKYTILPQEYSAIIADVDIFKTDAAGTDTWISYIAGDKTQGQGSAGYVKGSKFDINTNYKAQAVLNRGTAIEIKSRTEINNDNIGNNNTVCEQNEACVDKVTIPIGQVKLWTDETQPTEVIGAVTDDVTTIKLALTVKYGRETLPPLDWSIADSQVLNASQEIQGTLLNGDNPVHSLPVSFNSAGTATVRYEVPTTFVRYGTSPEFEEMDRNLPEREVLIRLNNSPLGLPPIKLKRPPVVLVHGLWGSGNPESDNYSWKQFEPLFNDKNQYRIRLINYESNHADSLAINSGRIKSKGINNVFAEMKDSGFAATKTDFIGHSMGGLLIREYCKDHQQECSDKIRKVITIDTPHYGSELANLIVAANQQPSNRCYKVLERLQKWGDKSIWVDSQKKILRGGFVDLSVGSAVLNDLNNVPNLLSLTPVVGIARTWGAWSYDTGVSLMWSMIAGLCDKVPDSSFVDAETRWSPVFDRNNDRIVNDYSQKGPMVDQFSVLDVDHVTILNNQTAIDKIKSILDRQ